MILFLLINVEIAFSQTTLIDSLKNIVAVHPGDTIGLNALLNLTDEVSRKDMGPAKVLAHQAIVLAEKLNYSLKLGNGYQYLMIFHQNGGSLDSAGYYVNKLEQLSNENPDNRKIKINYNQTAGLFYKNQGQYSRSLPFMLDNLNLLKAENESRAGQLLNLGNTYNNMGDFANAVHYHLQGLDLFEKINNIRGQSFCLQSLGNDFLGLKQFEQAKNYFERSVKLKEELGDRRGLINTWSGLGDVYKEQNQFRLAENYYLKSLRSLREMNLILGESKTQNQLGLLYKKMGDIPRAHATLSAGLALAKKGGDSTLSAAINSNLVDLVLLEKKEYEIENTLFNNLNTFINSGDRINEALSYYRLSEYYQSNNQFEKAYNNLKKYEQLKDSVEGKEVLIQIKDLEQKYETEKREKEIILLKKDQELQALALSRERTNVILFAFALFSVLIISVLLVNRYRLKNRANRMMEMERMRNTIARDLHDDIGSTLSSINIMSQLAMNENGNTNQQLKKIATHSAQMMENMSDIVWSINPKNDLAEQMVFKMKEFVAEILEPTGIDYSFHVEGSVDMLKLDSEKRKNLFLIFKEAINNAAKYSEGTNVTINLLLQKNHLHLEVIDNGKGFNIEEGKRGNGLSNMKDRAAAIAGALQHNSELGKGTRILLTVPIT